MSTVVVIILDHSVLVTVVLQETSLEAAVEGDVLMSLNIITVLLDVPAASDTAKHYESS